MPRSSCSRPACEIEIQQAILLELGARSDCRIWRNNVGMVAGANGRPVRFGTPGSADILGLVEVVPGLGRFIGQEVKAERARLRPEQLAWGEMVRRFGGAYDVVRSTDDALRALSVSRLEALLAIRSFIAGDLQRLDAAIEEARNA